MGIGLRRSSDCARMTVSNRNITTHGNAGIRLANGVPVSRNDGTCPIGPRERSGSTAFFGASISTCLATVWMPCRRVPRSTIIIVARFGATTKRHTATLLLAFAKGHEGMGEQ